MLKVEIGNGAIYLKGKPLYISSADYPYYRDDTSNWDDRLKKLKECGINVITCYFPWRHHEQQINGKRFYDFTGKTQRNRDVIKFLKLCHKNGLLVIAKPGPFIHAEINYGGLPDFVCPIKNPKIEAMLDHKYEQVLWSGSEYAKSGKRPDLWPLPSPLDQNFLQEVESWYRVIQEEVVKPLSYPEGPIFLVQIANEGIYSNIQRAPWDYDYSQSSLKYFRECLKEDYKSLSKYNRFHGANYSAWNEIEPVGEWKNPNKEEDLLAYMDWSAYQWRYMRRIYQLYSSFLSIELPYIINVNPPLSEPFGIDAWLCRVNPDEWPNIYYGFTNWIGVPSEERSVMERYLIMLKRKRGMNLEENWGLTVPYGDPYQFAVVCFFQTLLAIAGGATGYNIYTGVGTSLWDDKLDKFQKKPYPSNAPISDSGEVTPKAKTASLLNEFFKKYGCEFLETEPDINIGWGLYLPYAYIGVWAISKGGDISNKFSIPKCGVSLNRLQQQLLSSNIDYGIVNLQTSLSDVLKKYKIIIFHGGFFMDKETQMKLCDYVKNEGKLIIIGEIPRLDEKFQRCEVLKSKEKDISVVSEKLLDQSNFVKYLTKYGLKKVLVKNDLNKVWLYKHPVLDIQYLYVLAGDDETELIDFVYETQVGTKNVKMRIPTGSGAILRVEKGTISALLLKCINEYKKNSVVPFCQVNESKIYADVPCDILTMNINSSPIIKIINSEKEIVSFFISNNNKVKKVKIKTPIY